MERPDQLRPRGGWGCSLDLLPGVFGVSSLILEVVHSLSKKLVGNQVIRRNISLFTCVTDVLLRVQQSSSDTIITVTVATAGYNNSVSHQVIANGTQEFIGDRVRLVFRR